MEQIKKTARTLVALCMLLCMYGNASAAEKITKLKYYIDNNQASITTINTSVTTLLDSTFTVFPVGLSQGMHVLSIWTETDSARRSQINQVNFYYYTATSSTNKIAKVEFTIDNDSLNKQVFTTNAASIDQTFILNLNSVSAGMHVLKIRTIQDNGLSSHVQLATFVKANGNGTDSIATIEYFYDTDPGVGNGTKVNIVKKNTLDTLIELPVPNNLSLGTHRFCVRTIDNAGSYSLVNHKSIKICNVRPPVAGFETVRFGNTINFIDTSKHVTKWKYDFNDTKTDTVPSPLHTYTQFNRYYAVQAVQNSCSIDTARKTIDIEGIEQYAPKVAGQGLAVVNFYGAGFTSATRVVLKKGSTTITPDTIAYSTDGTRMKCIFNFEGKATGFYDVIVSGVTNLATQTFTNGFEIQPESENEFGVSIVGPSLVRNNILYDYKVEIHNTNNVVSRMLPVLIYVSNNTEIQFLDSIPNVRFDRTPVPDSILPYELVRTIDSFSFTGKVYLIYVDVIPNNDKYVFNLKYKALASGANTFKVIVMPSMDYDTSFNSKKTSKECMKSILSLILTMIDVPLSATPVVDCIWSNIKLYANGGALGSWAQSASSMFVSWYNLAGSDAANLSFGFAETVKACAPEAAAAGSGGAAAPAAAIAELFDSYFDFVSGAANVLIAGYRAVRDCIDAFGEDTKKPESRASFDPNAKYGPSGFTPSGYINNEKTMTYTINFENLSTATAPAQTVVITDTLNKMVFDMSSFEFDHMYVGGAWYEVPAHRQEFIIDYDLPNDTNNILRISAKLDTIKKVAKWWFMTLDKHTRKQTTNVLAGFLPPNVNHPQGEGWVSYKLLLRKSLVHNTQIKNRAVITFDNNAPILTDYWLNTIDKVGPTSSIINATQVSDSVVHIIASASDQHSGVGYLTLYMSKDGGTYESVGMVNKSQMNVKGLAPGHTYSFYVEANDNVGNREIKTPTAEATVNLVTGIKNSITKNGIAIYPNPTTGIVNINVMHGALKDASYKVYSLEGNIVISGTKTNASDISIDMSNLQSGIYFIELKDADQGDLGMSKIVLIK
jgi:hypothetical protein